MAIRLTICLSMYLLALVAAENAPGWETCGGLPPALNHVACPTANGTCCKNVYSASEGQWACCPQPNAVCCPSGLTCCPAGHTCQDKGSGPGTVTTCVPEPSPASMAIVSEPLDPLLGQATCKSGAPLPWSTTKPNILIIGDSVSIGYTPPVASLLEQEAFVQHSPWDTRDGGAEEAQYGWWCLDYLLRAPDGSMPVPDIIMFNWGLHNCLGGNNSRVPGQAGPADEYAPYLSKIAEKLKSLGPKLLFAITSPYMCATDINDIDQRLNAQAVQIMRTLGIPTVSLYDAIVGDCGPVPQPGGCHGIKGCWCPHCPPRYEWLANGTIVPALRSILKTL